MIIECFMGPRHSFKCFCKYQLLSQKPEDMNLHVLKWKHAHAYEGMKTSRLQNDI